MINRKIASRRFAVLAMAVVAGGAGASAASAQTVVTWDGTPAVPLPYVDGNNWSTDVTPTNAANEILLINNGGIATVATGQAAEGTFLHLGLQPGESGELRISGGTLTVGELRVGGRETIPDPVDPANPAPNGGGTGSVLQTGGDVFVTFASDSGLPPVQSLYIGDAGLSSGNTANGRYEIRAGTLTSGIADNDSIVVGTGVGTLGTFVQSGGIVTSRGFVAVGRRGAISTYTMTGGTLNVGQGAPLGTSHNRNLFVGDGDPGGITSTQGTFTQSVGTVNVGDATIDATQNLEIGRRSGTGEYTISSGALNVPNGGIVVGGGGEDPDGSGPLGPDPLLMNGSGTLRVSGTAAITVGDSALDGNAANHGSRGNMSIGFTSPSVAGTTTGLLEMTGGSMTFDDTNGIVAVGNGLGATGTLDLSGGTFSMTGTSALLDIGRNSSTGLVKLSGTGVLNVDQLTVNSSNVAVTRELRVEGGTLNVDFWEMGAGNTAATRLINISGGNVNVTGTGSTHRGGRLVTYNLTGGNTTFAGIFALDTSTMNIGATATTSATAKFATYRNGSGTTTITGGDVEFANFNDSGNQAGNVTMSGGVVDVTGNYNITNNTPNSGVAGTLSLTGATVNINNLTTGGNSGAPNSTLYISGGSVTIPTMTLSSTSVLKTDNAITLGSNITMGDATVNVNSGSLALTGTLTSSSVRTLTKTGPGALTISGAQSHVAGSAITNSAGTLNLNADAGGNLTVNANSTTNFGASQRLAALNVGTGATATVVDSGTFNRTINAGTVSITGGKLDLTKNKLVTNTPVGTATTVVGNTRLYDGLQGMVQSAKNGDAWDGNGLTSSVAATEGGLTTIGIANGAQAKGGIGETETTLWGGQTITGSSILAMYTYAGDANLDGAITGDDYSAIDFGILFEGMDGYANGDFNYDGYVTGDDYSVIDLNILLQGPQIPTGGAVASSAGLAGVTAVPEPSACGFALLGAAAAVTRRRRAPR